MVQPAPDRVPFTYLSETTSSLKGQPWSYWLWNHGIKSKCYTSGPLRDRIFCLPRKLFFFLSMWCPFLAPYWNFGISKHKYQLTPTYCRYEIWGDLQRSNNFCCVCVEVTETSVLCEDRLVVIHAFPESVEVQWWCLPTVLFWKDLFRDVLF